MRENKSISHKNSNLLDVKRKCLKRVIDLHNTAHSGHIGSSLSCLDLLVFLLGERMDANDEVILSKGHAAAALYATLAETGRIPEKMLEEYYQEGTYLAAHPPCGNKIPGIIFGTGSLGHGLSIAAGLALATRFTNKHNNIYCIVSDGDCNEGSTWEAALFAAHHNLSNLTVLVDRNGIQAFGNSDEVLNLEPFADKWRALNFETFAIENGNDLKSISDAFDSADKVRTKRPRCFIAKTTKGSGVSFMENELKWHYLPMDDDQYQQAISEIN